MDNTTNEKSNQRSAAFLEQCRADIDQLAAEGAAALDDAMVFAEKQLRACTMEWKQANKTVESTSGTQRSLLQIRQTTQQRLDLAQSEENDAYLAASTLQRMIEEARSLCDTASDDTSHILFKTSDVLQETFQRAQSSYNQKKNIRQEVEGALHRLDATDKAVKYSIAKAERNCGEKLLGKLMAERRCDVYKAEAEALRLDGQLQALVQRRNEEKAGLDDLEDLLASANRSVSERSGLEQLHQETSAAELAACQQDIDAAIQAIDINITCMEEERAATAARLEEAGADYERLVGAGAEAEEQARQVRENSIRAVEAARANQEQQLAHLEEELNGLRSAWQEQSAAYDNARVEQEAAARAVEDMKKQAEGYYQQVQTAIAEEKAARDAASTANRLLENAAKVRETVNAESSDLLRHAEDTLMEAAASAQTLLKEKSQARQTAQQAYDQAEARADAAGNKADEAELNLEIVQLDRDQAQERLTAAEEQAVERRRAIADELASAIAGAEEERTNAENAAMTANENIVSAKTFLENTKNGLESIIQSLPQLLASKKQQEENGALRLRDLAASHQEHGVELARMRQEAEAEVERLTGDRNERRVKLQSLEAEVEQVEELCSAASAKVDEIIAAGLRDILSAEEMVADLRYKEDMARSAAGDVVSLLTDRDQSPNQEQGGECLTEEALEEEAPVTEYSTEEAPAEIAPEEEAPVAEVQAEEASVEETLTEEALAEIAPEEEAPVAEGQAEAASVEEALTEEAPAEIAPEEEAPVAEAQAEEASVEEAPTEEAPAEIVSEEEAPVAEVQAQEASVEEAPAEDTALRQPDIGQAAAGPASWFGAAFADDQPLIQEDEEDTAAALGRSSPADTATSLLSGVLPTDSFSPEEIEYTQLLSVKSADLIRSLQQAAASTAPKDDAAADYADWMDEFQRDLGLTAPAPGRQDASAAQPEIKTPQLDVAEDGPLIQDAVMQQTEAQEQAENEAHAEEDELRRSILTNVDKAPNGHKKNRFFNFFRS